MSLWHVIAVVLLCTLLLVNGEVSLQFYNESGGPVEFPLHRGLLHAQGEQGSTRNYILVLNGESDERKNLIASLRDDVKVCFVSSVLVSTHRSILKLVCQSPENEADIYPSALLSWTERFIGYVHSLSYDKPLDNPLTQSSGSQYLDWSQWGLDRIDSRSRTFDARYTYPADGDGVKVYVIDTGVRVSHNEFEGRATFAFNAIGDGVNYDANGHGTHVSATIAGKNYGVAKKAQIIAVKVLDENGDGTIYDVLVGIEYVIDAIESSGDNGCVVNLSIGSGANSQFDSFVRTLMNTGAAVVVAAGNNGGDACNYSPSRVNGILTVASTDREDVVSSFSNLGPCVNISAPGSRILSASNSGDSSITYKSGTSMAAPHVSGVLAMVLSQDNGLSGRDAQNIVIQSITPNVIALDNTVKLYSGSATDLYPYALLYSKIDLSAPPPPPPPPPPPSSSTGAPVPPNTPPPPEYTTYSFIVPPEFQRSSASPRIAFNSTGFELISCMFIVMILVI